jgi:hypothetical protein
MGEYRYHLYTGGWGLTRDPDNLAFCYASYQVWKPIYYAPNYPNYMNPLFDAAWDNAEAQATAAAAVPYVYECQQIIMDDAAIIPVWLTAGYKAYLSSLDGVVSMAGRGPHNFWTLMDAHLSSGTGKGDTIRYGFMNDIASLNPIHASWVWDWYTMENIYDSLISFNPYNVAEDVEWMASWDIDTWDGGTKTKLTFHLRSDILWQDVPPKADRKYDILPAGATGVPVTTKDVAFTMISIRDNLDGWNQFLVADVNKVEINDAVLGSAQMVTPYTSDPMDVYGLSSVPTQDVIIYYNILSPWITLHWAGGLVILPYHIWYWVPWWDYDADGSIDTWLFDPEIEDALYGSGPYIFDHRVPGIEILLKSFKVGTAYKGIVSTGEYMNMKLPMPTVAANGYSLDLKPLSADPWYALMVEIDFGEALPEQEWYFYCVGIGPNMFLPSQIAGILQGLWITLDMEVYIISGPNIEGYHIGPVHLKTTYLGDSAGSTTATPLPSNGIVNYQDLFWMLKTYGSFKDTAKWKNNYGWIVDCVGSTTPTPLPADGKVDYKDLYWILKNYGKTVP